MKTRLYPIFRRHAYAIDLKGEGALGLLLVTAAYRYSDLHQTRADVTGEVEGEGYEAGGLALEGCRLVPLGSPIPQFGQGGAEKLVCDPVIWPKTTFAEAATGAILYHRRGGEAGADELLAYFDFAREKVSPARAECRIEFPDGLLLLE